MLEIKLLGGVHFTHHNKIIHTNFSPKELALLAYLVWSRRPEPRTYLGEMFWDGRSPEQGRSNLRTLMTRGRQKLDKYVTITRETVAFNETIDFWLDLTEFNRQIKIASYLYRQSTPPPASAGKRLAKALELYRGDFLSGFELPDSPAFMNWVEVERQSLKNEVAAAGHKLVQFHLDRADYKAGVQVCQQLLTLDPFDEKIHSQLMRSLAFDHQVAAALAHYGRYCDELTAQLDTSPGAALITTYEQLKRGQIPETGAALGQTIAGPGRSHLTNHKISSALPVPAMPLIGRENELAKLHDYFRHPAYRLATLVGAGGIGKTHLALAAGAQLQDAFADSVVFIPLIGLNNEAEIGAGAAYKLEAGGEKLAVAIAHGLNLTLRGHQSTKEQVFAFLKNKDLLLILDNFEHLGSDARTFVADILLAAPDVKVLVTTREPLQVQAECLLPLNELPYPAGRDVNLAHYDEDEQYASIRLFVERARRTFANFELNQANIGDIAHICRLVEGNPLAIELAAAWVGHFNTAEIAEAIQRNLAFLQTPLHDRPVRHQSMTEVLNYSWDLLTAHEKKALVHLAIFSGSFDRDAALEVAEAPLPILISLVNKSMLRLPQAGRYEMHGLLKRFAAEKWPEIMGSDSRGSDRLRAFQLRYGRYYLQFIAAQAQALHGEEPQQTIQSIQSNLANIHRAWQLMLEQDQFELIIASANGLSRFYHFAGLYRVAANLFAQSANQLQQQAERPSTDKHTARVALARVQSKRAFYNNRLGQFDQASRVAQLAAAMAQEQNDRYGEAESTLTWGEAIELQGTLDIPRQKYTAALRITREIENRRLEARSLRLLGRLAWRDGDITAADARYREALVIEQERGDRLAEGQLLTALGLNAELRGRLDSAQTYFEEAQAIYQKIGNQHRRAGVLLNLGWVWFMQGRYTETAASTQAALSKAEVLSAGVTFQQAADLFEATGDRRSAGEALRALGVVALKQQQPATARRLCQQALDVAREVNDRRSVSAALRSLGFIHRFEGAFDAAQTCFKDALTISQSVGDKTEIALLQNALSLNHWSVGQYELAGHYGRSALKNCISPINRTRFLADLVLMAGDLGDDEAALQYGQEGLLLARRIGLPSFEGRLSARLGEAHVRQGQWAAAQPLLQRAVERHEAIGEPYFTEESRAGLVRLYLAQNRPADAQAQTNKILCYLEKGTLAGCLAPFSVYLAVCQTLQTTGDERATAVTQAAYEQLQLQAAHIEDETLRRLFLEQVPAHREIARLALAGKSGTNNSTSLSTGFTKGAN